MLILMYGDDELKVQEARKEIFKKYKQDDYNYNEFTDTSVVLSEFAESMKTMPMMTDYYFVYARFNKKQFIRLKEYCKPVDDVVFLLYFDGFLPSKELTEGLQIDKEYDCRSLRGKDLSLWLNKRISNYGMVLDSDDKKYLLLLFSTQKEIDDTLYQMSFLNEFDRQLYIKELFSTRQRFVWDIFVDLILGRKDFFKKYANQRQQQIELSTQQFNLKLLGGLIFCLERIDDAPTWVSEKLVNIVDKLDIIIPVLFVSLINIQAEVKFETSALPITLRFSKLLKNLKELAK